MSYHKPFESRAPSFRQVEYEFTYASEAAARAAFDALVNKRYTLTAGGDYLLPIGHRIHARREVLDGAVVTFVGQLKAAEVATEDPAIRALELEIAGAEGSMTGKTVLA